MGEPHPFGLAGLAWATAALAEDQAQQPGCQDREQSEVAETAVVDARLVRSLEVQPWLAPECRLGGSSCFGRRVRPHLTDRGRCE